MSPQERGPRQQSLLDIFRREPNLKGIGTEFDFGGVKETVVTRTDFPLEEARQVLKDETIAIIGYGVQGPAQSLNLRDNGFNVIVGQREGKSFDKAVSDGWVPGKNLLPIEEAVRRATQIQYLLSDAGQKTEWNKIEPLLKPGDALYFSHGFSIAYQDQTGVVPPSFVDVILVAPKGSGRSVRELFQKGRGINSSFAIAQDATGRATERVLATGMAIGSGFLFPTTFEKEVFSDLTGERGVLMGAFYGLVQAGYNHLRNRGLSPQEAVSHTVEIATQTISKIIGEKGADGLIKNLPSELLPVFSSGFIAGLRDTYPVFQDLYEKVATGVETKITLEANSKPDYRDGLERELKTIRDSELGRTATEIRNRREQGPTVPSRIENMFDAIIAGALVGVMHAQYGILREKGHAPSEAFNETVEESTQSLYPLIDRQGIDWMYANCSTTAQRGALDWNGDFRDVLQEELRALYGVDTPGAFRIINGYPQIIKGILNSEMWKAGKTVRTLRPENQKVV